MSSKLKIGLVLGGHAFDTINMYPMFWGMRDIQIYPQLIENYLYDYAWNNDKYDGFVFYNMNMVEPTLNDAFGPSRKAANTFYKLGEDGKGIVVLHHALLAYPESKIWSDLVGIEDRSFEYAVGVDVDVHVEDKDHPICRGMSDFRLIDETYNMNTPGTDSTVLLSTTAKQSSSTLAWVRKCRESQVFCFALGHDQVAFGNDNFKEVLNRGILWTCGALD